MAGAFFYSSQSQLKDVNKLLKLDPGNTELMAQKQRLLSQAVSETFDSGMSRVSAISSATGQDLERLRKQAKQLGADTAFSATEAAEGMENLASAGFDTNEIISAMPGMLALAASSGESLASSSDIAASTLRGFGLEASQAAHVADVLAQNAMERWRETHLF